MSPRDRCIPSYKADFSYLQLQKKMSTVKPFIFGGIASLTAEVGKLHLVWLHWCMHAYAMCMSLHVHYDAHPPGTFPLDTTKTRLQVQGQQMDELCRSSKYRGMMHALLRIPKDEGLQALYKG